MQRLVQQANDKANKIFGNDRQTPTIEISNSDDIGMNVRTYENTMSTTTKTLETFNNSELIGLVDHEMGHLHVKDEEKKFQTQKALYDNYVSEKDQVCPEEFSQKLSEHIKTDKRANLDHFNLGTTVKQAEEKLTEMGASKECQEPIIEYQKTSSAMQRADELKADEYAIEAGSQDGLIQALEKVERFSSGNSHNHEDTLSLKRHSPEKDRVDHLQDKFGSMLKDNNPMENIASGKIQEQDTTTSTPKSTAPIAQQDGKSQNTR